METTEFRAPAPLWVGQGAAPLADVQRPQLLRFASDDFMAELSAELAKDRPDLERLLAREETWRDAGELKGSPNVEPTLYQAVHGRFYLVGANLVCRRPAFPDKRVEPRSGETVSFVIRRVEGANEYGWFASGGRGQWRAVANPERLARDGERSEERLPMFSLGFKHDGLSRRVWLGLVPVARRDEFELAQRGSPTADSDAPQVDPTFELFRAQITESARDLQAGLTAATVSSTWGGGESARLALLQPLKEALLVLLADLGELLEARLGVAVDSKWPATGSLQSLLQASAFGSTWGGLALSILEASRLPQWLQPMDPALGVPPIDELPGISGAAAAAQADLLRARLAELHPPGTALVEAPTTAWELAFSSAPAAPSQLPSSLSVSEDFLQGARYRIRVVYERPACKGVHQPLVSKPTTPFFFAHWLEPRAPMRTSRLSLPIEVSPRTWRAYPKTFAIMMSKSVRQHLDRVKGLAALEDKDVGPPLPISLGHVCSLSIPIVTFCALILLMIIVSLLNFVFWWLPFLKICLPIRSLR